MANKDLANSVMDSRISSFESCPLCRCEKCVYIHRDRNREYFRCPVCEMVHVPCRYHTTLEEEKERYDLHRNDPENQGYMNLLGKLFAPVRDRLKPGSRGLDFGSGPSPVLASLFREEGYGMAIFDKFYANNPGVFDARYDFVTASEVAEHLCDPFRELNRLYGILKPGGLLGILTGMLPCAEKFPKWHYKNDKTHICFFAASTFRWIAGEWGSEIVYLEDDVVIIRKPALAEMH